MRKCRICFEKTGKAKYVSHLDLMRAFQRLFVRSGVSIKHTEGFNPHPYMVFALPLSVGTESRCELADFELTDDNEALETIPERLTAKASEGIVFKEAYIPQRKLKDIFYIEAEGIFEYDNGVSSETVSALQGLFEADEIIIPKKTKKGISDTDIKPGIKSISFDLKDNCTITVRAVVTALNPSTNPELIAAAVRNKLSGFAPDFAEFKRLNFLDADLNIFR